MEWSEIHDPKNEFEFQMEWTLVGSLYTPEDIQEIINKNGVQGMVRIVNQEFKLRTGHTAMHLVKQDNRKMVIQS